MSALPDPLGTAVHDCDGGWKVPTEAMVMRRWPDPPTLKLDATVAEAQEYVAETEHVLFMRHADLNSIYPCEVCQPERYARWEGGHYAKDHWCPDCTAKGHVRKPFAKEAPKDVGDDRVGDADRRERKDLA